MSGTEPLLHVRRIRLPWRDPTLTRTECGRLPQEFTQVIEHDDLIALIRDLGQQRASMQVCMTCWSRAGIYNAIVRSWEENPERVIEREAQTGYHEDNPLRQELRAIATLIAAHPDEFADLMHSLSAMVTPEQLASKRAEKRYRRAVVPSSIGVGCDRPQEAAAPQHA